MVLLISTSAKIRSAAYVLSKKLLFCTLFPYLNPVGLKSPCNAGQSHERVWTEYGLPGDLRCANACLL
jgi:hypothetical protein